MGLVCSVGLVGFIGVGAAIAQANGQLPDQRLPLSVSGCTNNGTDYFSSTTTVPSYHMQGMENSRHWKDTDDSAVIKILSLSFIWNSAYGALSAIIFGLIFSFVFKSKNMTVNRAYFSPPLLRLWTWLFPEQMKNLVILDETKIKMEEYK